MHNAIAIITNQVYNYLTPSPCLQLKLPHIKTLALYISEMHKSITDVFPSELPSIVSAHNEEGRLSPQSRSLQLRLLQMMEEDPTFFC